MGFPSEYCHAVKISLFVLTECTNVTDKRTHGRTLHDGNRPRLHSIARQKCSQCPVCCLFYLFCSLCLRSNVCPGEAVMFSPSPVVCPVVCPDVPCQRGLVRRAGKSIRHMQQRRDDMIGRSFKLASLSHVMLCYVKACTSAGCTMSNASVAMTTESRPAAVSRPRVVSVSSSQLVVMTTESRPDGVVMTTESRPAAVPRPRVVSVSSSQLVVSCLKPDKPNGLSSLHRLVPLL